MTSKPLNAIPCLDAGYVSLVQAHLPSDVVAEVSSQHLRTIYEKKLTEMASLTLLIKYPLFVHMYVAQFGLKYHVIPVPDDQLQEAFVPDETFVRAPTLETSREIAQDIKSTTEALLINPMSYRADGCEPGTSKMITPINTYTTVVISGPLSAWLDFANSDNLHPAIDVYRATVEQIVKAEWYAL